MPAAEGLVLESFRGFNVIAKILKITPERPKGRCFGQALFPHNIPPVLKSVFHGGGPSFVHADAENFIGIAVPHERPFEIMIFVF
jgi:hypothetical protein